MATATIGPNWWENPGIRNALGNAVSDLGYGLATSRRPGNAFQAAAQRADQLDPSRQTYALAQQDKAKREATLQAAIANLRDKYGAGDLADMVEAGGMDLNQAWNAVIERRKPVDQSEFDQRYAAGQKFGLEGDNLNSFALTGSVPGTRNSNVTYGLTPIFGKDSSTGESGMGVQGSDGSFKLVDTGSFSPTDPAAMAGNKAAAVVDSKTSGAARAALPSAENAYQLTQQALANFDPNASGDAAKSVQAGMGENFGNVLGVPQQMLPVLPKTNRANFQNIVDQLSGQAFLNIRQALKGAGQVTDYEGAKGEIALSRMAAAAKSGDETAFKTALLDYQQAIDNGMRLLRETAQGGYAAGSQNVTGKTNYTYNPATGELE